MLFSFFFKKKNIRRSSTEAIETKGEKTLKKKWPTKKKKIQS